MSSRVNISSGIDHMPNTTFTWVQFICNETSLPVGFGRASEWFHIDIICRSEQTRSFTKAHIKYSCFHGGLVDGSGCSGTELEVSTLVGVIPADLQHPIPRSFCSTGDVNYFYTRTNTFVFFCCIERVIKVVSHLFSWVNNWIFSNLTSSDFTLPASYPLARNACI